MEAVGTASRNTRRLQSRVRMIKISLKLSCNECGRELRVNETHRRELHNRVQTFFDGLECR